jgi:excisionase family DNA binding protein
MLSESKTAAIAAANQSLLVTIPQAAKMLSTTVWAVRELVWANKLPVVRLGRRFLLRPVDLEAFVNQQVGQ